MCEIPKCKWLIKVNNFLKIPAWTSYGSFRQKFSRKVFLNFSFRYSSTSFDHHQTSFAKILLNHLPPQAFIPFAYHYIICCYPCCQWNLKVCIYFFETKAKWIEIKTIMKMWKITPNSIRKFLNFSLNWIDQKFFPIWLFG